MEQRKFGLVPVLIGVTVLFLVLYGASRVISAGWSAGQK